MLLIVFIFRKMFLKNLHKSYGKYLGNFVDLYKNLSTLKIQYIDIDKCVGYYYRNCK